MQKTGFIRRILDSSPLYRLRAQNTASAEKMVNKGIRHSITRVYKYKVSKGIDNFEEYVRMAQDPNNYDRTFLYALYEEIMDDGHVISVTGTRKLKSLQQRFVLIDPSKAVGNRFDDNVKELKTVWFQKLLGLILDTRFWGHTLVEAIIQDGKLVDVELVPRENVRPEYGDILLKVGDRKGVPFREEPVSDFVMEFGEKFDLGLLKKIGKAYIYKLFAISDWSKRNELYGLPMLIVKAATRNKQERQSLFDSLLNFGQNRVALLEPGDEVELKESTQAFAYQTFPDKAEFQNKEISKAILGQTMTTEDGSSLSQAQIHMQILESYIGADLRWLENITNHIVFPFLIKNGFEFLDGYKFGFYILTEEYENELKEAMEGEKKKLSVKADKKSFKTRLKNFYGKLCGKHFPKLKSESALLDLSALVSAAVRRVYEGELAQGDIDKDLWIGSAEALFAGIQKGFDLKLQDAEANSPEFDFLNEIRTNAHVFTAFKNHQNIIDMVEQLTDEDGNRRSFAQFKEAVKSLNEDYNVNWLRTEYQNAIASGRMGAAWLEYKEGEDLFPYLTYQTVGDERVRDKHKKLDGVSYGINDPFWDTYFPPNGHNCRCDVEQNDDGENPFDGDLPVIDDAFRNNVGTTRKMYSDSHPYFEVEDEVREGIIQYIEDNTPDA